MLKTLFFDHYKHYCCYSLISDLANTYEKIYISAISKVLAMIKGMTLHFGCSRFTMSLKKFFAIKFELPIDTQSQSITDGLFMAVDKQWRKLVFHFKLNTYLKAVMEIWDAIYFALKMYLIILKNRPLKNTPINYDEKSCLLKLGPTKGSKLQGENHYFFYIFH